ncbi:UDP-N-acetylmuramate--L-alanine ligase [Geofilum rubicundum]|uniref:Cytoplasmic peptidoglycan synthetase, N-terminal n=1 Tax=Geofilum rubicundum JCM 15548 TaxID=1236989 RepID=A0A0E9LVB8_9BACT|nr:Mur ligase family protein [Geofilum rubicundum]GAO29194.1 cytoplasmic peptidoglycan synthetase, N-terminal precursor [Geofilum rubicundum JCM 15548]
MRIHFIAIGGSAMHNLAIALKENHEVVSGSDDEVFEPSRSRLLQHGLLPEKEGWDPDRITHDLDAVILGMHARKDNPELLRALEIGVKVYSYPEYLYEQCRHKKRVVIAGSHGKTTVTSMVMHALRDNQIDFDYMVGAQLEGFDTMVRLSKSAKVVVFEGDEYLSSPIDLRPKFLWYRPHLALITGMAWDHVNVFPTIEIYNEQFRLFVDSIIEDGYLTWFSGDSNLKDMMADFEGGLTTEPYGTLATQVEKGRTQVLHHQQSYPVPVFGNHNMQNMAGAMNICRELGLSEQRFLTSMKTFKGASRRLQVLGQNEHSTVFYDFAHAPSKLKATIDAVKEQFPDRTLVACLELHTFSSLNKTFLPQYRNTMEKADKPIVFYNPEVLKHKQLPALSVAEVSAAFNIPASAIVTSSSQLLAALNAVEMQQVNLLVMTSGNLGGINIKEWVDKRADLS